MHQHVVALDMQERPGAQPRDELLAVGRVEHILEGVALAGFLDALGHADEVQVVIAQHRHSGGAEVLYEAQAAQRIGAAVHEVADEPEPVAARVEADLFDERLEGREAALEIADRVGRQGYLAAETM